MSRCQVCERKVKDNSINCPLHQHVHKKSIELAKWIWKADLDLISSKGYKKYLLVTPAKQLSKDFDVSISTVRRHLKLAGFSSMRGWTKKEGKGF